MANNYSELLKDPQWQKMRLKILERDNFCCQVCLDDKTTLHVHHRKYISGRKPWEYTEDDLVTLCAPCHQIETESFKITCDKLLEASQQRLLSNEVSQLADGIMCADITYPFEVILTMIQTVLKDREFQKQVMDLFFERLKNGKKKDN